MKVKSQKRQLMVLGKPTVQPDQNTSTNWSAWMKELQSGSSNM